MEGQLHKIIYNKPTDADGSDLHRSLQIFDDEIEDKQHAVCYLQKRGRSKIGCDFHNASQAIGNDMG